MPRVIFVSPSGERFEVEAEAGCSIMYAAVVNGVDGITGECGGCAVCGTCHAYVDPPYIDRLPAMEGKEDDLLVFASGRSAESRLCCQIIITEELDGVTVRLPESQP